jgi:hypothetical protein
MSIINIIMDDTEDELDRDVDNIIFQIKNQGKNLKTVQRDRPELQKEDLERFVIDNASTVVMDSIEMVQSLKMDVMAGGDSKMVEAVSELVKATTSAIEALSKLKMSDDKLKGQKELKQMDIDAKTTDDENVSKSGLFISREELLNKFFENQKRQLNDSPPIDV